MTAVVPSESPTLETRLQARVASRHRVAHDICGLLQTFAGTCLAPDGAMATQLSFGGRWALLGSALGLVAVTSCGSDTKNDDAKDAPSAGTSSTSGGTSGGEGGEPAEPNAGSGGTAPRGLAGACSGGEAPARCNDDPRPCAEYETEASCAAAGCIPTTGKLSALLDDGVAGAPHTGGAPSVGGAGHGRAPVGLPCEATEDVFISCEEGYGGGSYNFACNDSCTSCLEGPWTVGRHEPFTRQDDCAWTCVDGEQKRGFGL